MISLQTYRKKSNFNSQANKKFQSYWQGFLLSGFMFAAELLKSDGSKHSPRSVMPEKRYSIYVMLNKYAYFDTVVLLPYFD